MDYVDTRKKEGVTSSTILMARDALKLLLEMNDAAQSIKWKKIARVIPPARRHGTDRPPDRR